MNSFKRTNFIIGWVVFAVSVLVYYLTMEPSVSLWDCGEFITTSYKMEVGHPPGAPLFMMINRFFSLFAADTSKVAAMINFASVVASALTIMFLYWTIVHLALKITGQSRETAAPKDALLVFGAGLIGSLAYAFTDTFWFSAVEGEVYAQSSLFTALVFWAMLKWENEFDKPYSSRWLILIAYLMGLSIGVHLLNLLTIPALGMIYYYKTAEKHSRVGWWKAFGLSVLLLGVILFFIIPQTVAVGGWFDRMFVNAFGVTKNIGFIFFALLLLGAVGFGIYYTHKKGKVLWNTVLLCLGVMLIGYGTYASVIIRSSANPPLNSNQPDDAYSLKYFLDREQYGDTPLIYGQYYSSPILEYQYKDRYYFDEESNRYKSYEVPDYKSIQYAPGTTTLFPRMFSRDHEQEYKKWVDIKGTNVKYGGKTINVPTFGENLAYFFKYQLNYMYWRYFLWNFVGRQNDLQGAGGAMKGNWISGIKPIDELYVGTQDNLPTDLQQNKARNTYYFLPFLLGLAGLLYQLSRDRNGFVVVMFLFLMTGLAIILYLNQPPNQPRERDYAFAGSFYAFAIWIGLGVMWIDSLLKKVLKNSSKISAVAATVICSVVPVILIAQNWDDHDRSNRYLARDYGANYLRSTLPGSILFAFGDNDTFGPWYSQEVESVREDVRICNLSYLAADWYVNQMSYKYNDSDPIAMTIPKRVYLGGNEYLQVVPIFDKYTNIKDVLNFIAIDAQQNATKKSIYNSISPDLLQSNMEIIPASKIAIPVNKENALKAGIIKESDLPNVVDTIFIELKENALNRSQYMLLDMIGSSDWTRPIYFTQSFYGVNELGLRDYLQFDGFAYRLVPIKTPAEGLQVGRIDTDYLYDKVKNDFKYGNVKDPKVNIDVFSRNTIRATQIRNVFARLAIELANKGEKEKASEVILKSLEEVPYTQTGHDYFTPVTIEALYVSGNEAKAKEVLEDAVDYYSQYLNYFSQFDKGTRFDLSNELNETLQSIYYIYNTAMNLGMESSVEPLKPYAEMLFQ